MSVSSSQPPLEAHTASLGGTHRPKSALPVSGDLIDNKYVLQEELGRGGMGIVFAAAHRELSEQVALKIVTNATPHARLRMLREARIAVALRAANIARVRDVGVYNDFPYIVMDRLEGRSLADELRLSGPLSADRLCILMDQVCAGLEHAHTLGIVHRDLKPSNLFVSNDSQVRILDFGVAKGGPSVESLESGTLTQATSTLGTPRYMAPEQVRNAATIDVRADIWSLGVTMYECLTGTFPFYGESAAAITAAIAADTPAPLPTGIPDFLEYAIRRCLEKAPEKRFQTVSALRQALATKKRKAHGAPMLAMAIVGGGALLGWTWHTRASVTPIAAEGMAPMQMPAPTPMPSAIEEPKATAAALPEVSASSSLTTNVAPSGRTRHLSGNGVKAGTALSPKERAATAERK